MSGAAAEWTLDPATVAAQVDRLPALPDVVVELIGSIDDPDADTDLLARKIARDQALVARLLRVANSSFYGLQGKVSSVHDAIVVLGFRGVRTLATAAAVTGCFSAQGLASRFDFRAFWAHSLGVALCARGIARRLRANEENAFTAALLHDVGRLVLASRFPHHFDAVVAYRERCDCLWQEAERDVLGIDHAQIGCALAGRWRFAPLVGEAIAWHHRPESREIQALAHVVHVADALAHALGMAGEGASLVPPVSAVSWNALALDREDFLALFAEVEGQHAGICELLAG